MKIKTTAFVNINIIFFPLRQRQQKPQISRTQMPNQLNQTQLRSGRKTSSASGTRLQTGTLQISSPPRTGLLLGEQ